MTQLLPYGSECWRPCETSSTPTPPAGGGNQIYGGTQDPNTIGFLPGDITLWAYYNQTLPTGEPYQMFTWNPNAFPLRWR